MGNCLTQGAKTWADDGWDCVESTSCETTRYLKEVPPKVNGGSTVVKIKLTKKQLEEMLGKAGINTDKKLSIELLLKHALNRGCDESARDRKRHWRPALLTIPEAAE